MIRRWVRISAEVLRTGTHEFLRDRPAAFFSFFFPLLFVVIWPGSMIAAHPLDSSGFLAWTTLSRGWGFVAAAFIIVVPLVQELYAIGHQWRKQRRARCAPSDCLSLQSQCTSPAHSKAEDAEAHAVENGVHPLPAE